LHQNAFHDIDTYSSLEKQLGLLDLIMSFYYYGKDAIENNADIEKMFKLEVREKIGRAKYVEESQVKKTYSDIKGQILRDLQKLATKEENLYD
jgi:V/A-type H+-transporting ATPase subunit A